MNFNFNYKYQDCDLNWGSLAGELSLWWLTDKTNFIAPNPFIHILYQYKDKINDIDKIESFIETGTNIGQTSKIFSNHVNQVYTIELDVDEEREKLYIDIKNQCPNIEYITGDSVNNLNKILNDSPNTRFIFLLDAHGHQYSPLKDELISIKKCSNINNHVIIIDDGIDFGSVGWPTENEIKELILNINPDYNIINTKIARDIYIIY